MSIADKSVPIIEMARGFEGKTEVDRLGIVLMEAWGKADRNSSVSQHPASYVATFADMARAAIEWLASRKPEAAPSDTDLPQSRKETIDWLVDLGVERTGAVTAVDSLIQLASRTSQPVQVEVTDDMVEKATRLLANGSDVSEYPFTALDAAHMRDKARQILEIALGGGDHAE